MSNVNTFVGYQDIPAQVVSTTTATSLLVPVSGVYAGLPSPALPAGVGLYLGLEQDIPVQGTFDANKFSVRVQGKLFTGAASTVVIGLYQAPNTIVQAGTQSTVANVHAVANMTTASAAITGASNFVLEASFIWDSASNLLNGYVDAFSVNGALQAVNTAAAGANVATSIQTLLGAQDLKFLPFITFGTANAANSWTVSEFAIDRA